MKKIKHEKGSKEIIYLLKGRIFPDYDERETGISEQLVIKALSKTTGISPEAVTKKWKTLGDLGKVAEELIKNKFKLPFWNKIKASELKNVFADIE